MTFEHLIFLSVKIIFIQNYFKYLEQKDILMKMYGFFFVFYSLFGHRDFTVNLQR